MLHYHWYIFRLQHMSDLHTEKYNCTNTNVWLFVLWYSHAIFTCMYFVWKLRFKSAILDFYAIWVSYQFGIAMRKTVTVLWFNKPICKLYFTHAWETTYLLLRRYIHMKRKLLEILTNCDDSKHDVFSFRLAWCSDVYVLTQEPIRYKYTIRSKV